MLLLVGSASSWASSIQVGQPLPDLTITDRGELMFAEEEFSFQPWQVPGNLGKVHVLQYMAATMKARSQSKPFTDALEQQIPFGSYHVTTVINLDDALFGTGGFVIGEVKSSKKQYPMSTIVVDEDGTGLEAWQLNRKSSAIVVVDASGTVLYLKQGAMTEQEIESTLQLIRTQLPEEALEQSLDPSS